MRLRIYMLRRKRMKKLIKSLVLFLIASVLSVVLLPLGIIWTVGEIIVRIFTSEQKKSAFAKSIWFLTATLHSLALGLDQIGNAVCRDMFNRLLVKENGYKFGKVQETISSVLGKNQMLDTLSLWGWILISILELFERNHCIKSIIYFPNEKKDDS